MSTCAFVAVLPWVTGAAAYTESRQLLLGAYFLIGSIAFLAIIRTETPYEDSLFMFVIGCLSVSLLIPTVLLSDSLLGYDIHWEFQVFLQVLRSGRWEAQFESLYGSVTSITVFPSAIALVSGIDGVTIFRLVFPALYSLMPVFLYRVYRKIMLPQAAFLSVFLFMSYSYDGMISLARQEVAEVLLVILLLIFLSPRMNKGLPGAFVAIMLTIGFVTAHYSMAYLYLSLVLTSALAIVFRRRDLALSGSTALAIAVVTCFAWYMYVAGGEGIITLGRNISLIINGIVQDFFSPSSRPQEAVALFSFRGMPGILHYINRVTVYLVQLCLVLGFLTLCLKRGKSEWEKKTLPIMAVAFMFIGAAIVVPFFAATLEFNRIYHVALLFAAPCFVYGVGALHSSFRIAGSFLGKISRVHIHVGVSARSIATVVLFSYFLFSSGWVWAVDMDRPTSVLFDSERLLNSSEISLNIVYFNAFTLLGDIAGARWLLAHHSNSRLPCADVITRYHVLNSYGEFPRDGPTLPDCYGYWDESYVFTSEFNNLRGFGQSTTRVDLFSISDISVQLNKRNRVYSDGGAVIYD